MVANGPNETSTDRLRQPEPRPGFRIAPAPRRRERVLSRLRRREVIRAAIIALVVLVLIVLAVLFVRLLLDRARSNVTTVELAANAGGIIEAGDIRYRVTMQSISAGQTVQGTNLPPAPDLRTYVAVKVSVENLGTVPVPPGRWTLLMSDDADRFPLVVPGPDQAAIRAELAPGDRASYTLIFDVPTDSGKRVKSLFYRDATSDQAIRFATFVSPA